ncbi:MAG: sialidase family protein [Methanoregula sp.]
MPDDSIVLMGGMSSDGLKNDVWRSTDLGATWTQKNASAGWVARYTQSSVAMPDGSIVLMGGMSNANSGGRLNDVWRSTDFGATWTQVNSSAGWSPRGTHSSVVIPYTMLDASIILMGGSDINYFKNDVWQSTNNGATWTPVTQNAEWSIRYSPKSVVMPDGSIVLMGGSDNGASNGGRLNDVWRLPNNGATWTPQAANAGWSARSEQSSVATPDGSIVLMGGVDSSGILKNDVWQSTNKGAMWTPANLNAEWFGRYGHSTVATHDGNIILMGGCGFSNDVWRLMPNQTPIANITTIVTTPATNVTTIVTTTITTTSTTTTVTPTVTTTSNCTATQQCCCYACSASSTTGCGEPCVNFFGITLNLWLAIWTLFVAVLVIGIIYYIIKKTQ